MKCLICLFSAAAILILTGGAKKAFVLHSLTESAAKVHAAALLYVPSSEESRQLMTLAETSPEFLLYAAGNATLKPLAE